MDRIERSVSLFGVGIAMVISIVSSLRVGQEVPVHHDPEVRQGQDLSLGVPTSTYGEFCEHVLKASESYWATRFLFVFVVALIILFFALRRKRAGVACFACFLGIGLGIAGVVFVFLGAWLIVRAFRLQRYGEATWIGVEQGGPRDGPGPKRGPRPDPEAFGVVAGEPAPRTRPGRAAAASKRYTPKQKPRKR